jgi:hypothetical protein
MTCDLQPPCMIFRAIIRAGSSGSNPSCIKKRRVPGPSSFNVHVMAQSGGVTGSASPTGRTASVPARTREPARQRCRRGESPSGTKDRSRSGTGFMTCRRLVQSRPRSGPRLRCPCGRGVHRGPCGSRARSVRTDGAGFARAAHVEVVGHGLDGPRSPPTHETCRPGGVSGRCRRTATAPSHARS